MDAEPGYPRFSNTEASAPSPRQERFSRDSKASVLSLLLAPSQIICATIAVSTWLRRSGLSTEHREILHRSTVSRPPTSRIPHREASRRRVFGSGQGQRRAVAGLTSPQQGGQAKLTMGPAIMPPSGSRGRPIDPGLDRWGSQRAAGGLTTIRQIPAAKLCFCTPQVHRPNRLIPMRCSA